MKIRYLVLTAVALTFDAGADNSTLDAAIGGGIGGAAGAAIGNEIGGREGAIVGGAIGGAAGAAINTDKEPKHTDSHKKVYYHEYQPRYEYSPSRFCPPGQAKKGRC